MNQTNVSSTACRSVFQEGADAPTTEKYTQLWITLINQIEKGKQILSATR